MGLNSELYNSPYHLVSAWTRLRSGGDIYHRPHRKDFDNSKLMAKLAQCKLRQGFAPPCCERGRDGYLLLPPAKRKMQSTAQSLMTQRLDAMLFNPTQDLEGATQDLVQTNPPPYHFRPCLPRRSADFSEGAGTTVLTQRPKGSTDTIGLESLWQAPSQISFSNNSAP